MAGRSRPLGWAAVRRRLQEPRGRASLLAIVWSFVIQAAVMASGVLSARALGPEDRGYLGLIVIAATAIPQIGQLGIPPAVTFEIARNGIPARGILDRTRGIVSWQLVLLPLAQALALGALGFAEYGLWGAALLSIPVGPALLLQQYGLAVLQGHQAYARLNVQRAISPVLYPVILGVGLLLDLDTLAAVTAAWTLSYLVAVLTTWRAIRPYVHDESPGAAEPPPVRRFLNYGIKGTLGTATPSNALRLDQLIVGLALSPATLGLYNAAQAFVNFPRFIAQNLSIVALPATAAAGAHRQRSVILGFTALSGTVALAIAAPIAIAAEPLVELFFGQAFVVAAPAVQILMIGSVAAGCRRTLSAALRGADQPGAGSIGEALAVGLAFPAAAAGAHFGGLTGVAWGVSISSVLSLAYLLVRTLQLSTSDSLEQPPERGI
jgi:O-antigen/teichoic acid export membrane protein